MYKGRTGAPIKETAVLTFACVLHTTVICPLAIVPLPQQRQERGFFISLVLYVPSAVCNCAIVSCDDITVE